MLFFFVFHKSKLFSIVVYVLVLESSMALQNNPPTPQRIFYCPFVSFKIVKITLTIIGIMWGLVLMAAPNWL